MLTPSAARTHRGTSYRPWFLFTGRGVRKCAIFISPGTNRLHVLSCFFGRIVPSDAAGEFTVRPQNPIAPAAPPSHYLPTRFRALALFGRRPSERMVRSSLPAAENLRKSCHGL